jgi:hypothetical protein
MLDLVPISSSFASKEDIRRTQIEIQKQIDQVKRQTGLAEAADPEFREFFLNWKSMGDEMSLDGNRKPRLRWLLRRIKQHMYRHGKKV